MTEGPAALTEAERATLEENLAVLGRLGDLVGGWGMKSVQARRKSFTMTITFDKDAGDPFKVQEFAEVMEKCPAMYVKALRRLLRMDDELKERDA